MLVRRLAIAAAWLGLGACAESVASPPDDGIVPGPRKDPAVLWEIPERAQGQPLVDSSIVYANGYSHELLAIDKYTGRILWRARTQNGEGAMRGHGSAISGDVIVVSDAQLYAFDKRTGVPLWTFDPPDAFVGYSRLESDDSAFYVGSIINGWVFSISATTGHQRWAVKLDTAFLTVTWDPLLHDGVLYVPIEVLPFPRRGGIAAIDAHSGRVLWQRTFQPRKPGRGSGAIGPPVVYENVLAVSLNDGTIWAMNRNDGSVLWKAPSLIATDNDDVRPLTLFRNLVVAGSVTMAVYAYDMRTGEIRWHVNPDLKGSIFGWMSADDRELFAVTSARLSRIDTTGAILGTIGSPDEKLCFLNGVELDRDVVYVNGCKAFFAIKRSMINEPPFP